MIGYKITGTSLEGKPVTGIVLDKVLCLQSFGARRDALGPVTPMPVALDAYLVQEQDGALHLVPPGTLTHVEVIEPEMAGMSSFTEDTP